MDWTEVTTATTQQTGQFRVQIPVVPRDFPLPQNVWLARRSEQPPMEIKGLSQG